MTMLTTQTRRVVVGPFGYMVGIKDARTGAIIMHGFSTNEEAERWAENEGWELPACDAFGDPLGIEIDGKWVPVYDRSDGGYELADGRPVPEDAEIY